MGCWALCGVKVNVKPARHLCWHQSENEGVRNLIMTADYRNALSVVQYLDLNALQGHQKSDIHINAAIVPFEIG